MSSIEKFVNKLDSLAEKEKGATGTKHQATESPARQSVERASVSPEDDRGSVTTTKVTIDYNQLQNAGLLAPDNTYSRLAEEYRTIKRPLLNNAFGQNSEHTNNSNLIMVTSAVPGEGKSFTSINLAISMAMEMDRTVLLAEADVSRPSICRYLGLSQPRQGLVDYLAEPGIDLSGLLLKTNLPKFTLLPAGSQRPNTAELLASENMIKLMDELANRYPDRIVIFDSPPLLLSSEAVVLSGMVGQVVLVVESEATRQSFVTDALTLLDPNQIVGVVLNKSLVTDDGAYGVDGGYGYGGLRRD